MRTSLSLLLVLVLAAPLAWAEKAPPLRKSYPPEQVAEGVWVIHGPLGVPSPENQGFMNNPAFVVTDAGVVVVEAPIIAGPGHPACFDVYFLHRPEK